MSLKMSSYIAVALWSLSVVTMWGSDRENWTHWRGPTADGVAGKHARPPLQWSNETNLAWVAELPGEGSATPIVLDDKVFVVSAEQTTRKSPTAVVNDQNAKTVPDEFYYRFLVICLQRDSGKVLWQKVAAEEVPHEGRHPTNTYAAGSPTTDGERLYISFGSRGFYCYSLDGELLWHVDLGDMRTRFGWGEAVTPVLIQNMLIINWDQESGSFLVALDKFTGKELWKVDRPMEVTSWNTPLATMFNGRPMIVVNGTHRVRGYDARTGQEIWACGGQTVNAIPSPIRYQDTAICMSGYRGALACAIPLDSKGDITDTDGVQWRATQGTPYVPSPVISGQRLLFTAGNTDVLSCLDVQTGKPVMERKRLSGLGSMYASPILAGGHFYFTGREGATVVVRDDENLTIVAVNELKDATDASPVAVDDQLFLRSWKRLYCLRAAGQPRAADSSSNEKKSSLHSDLSFREIELEPSAETSANVSSGDVDGDGDVDLVLAKGRHWPLVNQLLINDGRASFLNRKVLGSRPDRTYSAVLGDWDRDGDLDVAVSNDKPDEKLLYRNNGQGQFSRWGLWGESNWNTRNAAVADLNGDGSLDLIAANRGSPSYVCLNDGNGRFEESNRIKIPCESATTIAPADFNGDGRIDLAIPHRDGGTSRIYINNGSASFSPASAFGPDQGRIRAIAAGDLDQDGWVDLVIGDERQGTVLCLNDGQGNFRKALPLGSPKLFPTAIAIGDLNGDQMLDLAIGYATAPCSIFYNSQQSHSFREQRLGDGRGTVYGLTLADLNADGSLDIAVARSDAQNLLYLQSQLH